MRREIKTLHFVRFVLMVFVAILFAYSCGAPSNLTLAAAMFCICLATWHFYQYRVLKTFLIEKGEPGSHVVWSRSVIPVRDVDMNKVDKEIDKQLSEMEKMRR